MSSRDSGHWRHLSIKIPAESKRMHKKENNFLPAEHVNWNNAMLFFTTFSNLVSRVLSLPRERTLGTRLDIFQIQLSLVDGNFELFSFSAYLHLLFSFNSYVLLVLRIVFECLASFKASGVYHAINHGRIGNRELFRRSSRITVNTVTLNALYKVNTLWPKFFFSRNVTYIPPMSDSSLWLLSKALDFWEIIILTSALKPWSNGAL